MKLIITQDRDNPGLAEKIARHQAFLMQKMTSPDERKNFVVSLDKDVESYVRGESRNAGALVYFDKGFYNTFYTENFEDWLVIYYALRGMCYRRVYIDPATMKGSVYVSLPKDATITTCDLATPFSTQIPLSNNMPGRWISVQDGYRERVQYSLCSLCGYQNPMAAPDQKNCPVCGAEIGSLLSIAVGRDFRPTLVRESLLMQAI